MTWLFHDTYFQQHETGRHPERPLRLARIDEHLRHTDLVERCRTTNWSDVDLSTLARLHDPDYISAVQQCADDGGGHLDADTVVSSESYRVALRAGGAACEAVRQVVLSDSPPDNNAFCLVRPPGHHALRHTAMGFCLFNNIAVAAQFAIDEFGLDRVLVIDWDVHHGNGTQDAFYESEQVGFLSIHRYPFYPGTGADNETGAGAGLGATVNVPVAMGITRREFLDQFENALSTLAAKIRPQLILLSAGFDGHHADPVGSIGLETEDFEHLTRLVQQASDEHCQGKLVSMLEGGYNVEVLPHCVEIHLRQLLDHTPPPQ